MWVVHSDGFWVAPSCIHWPLLLGVQVVLIIMGNRRVCRQGEPPEEVPDMEQCHPSLPKTWNEL